MIKFNVGGIFHELLIKKFQRGFLYFYILTDSKNYTCEIKELFHGFNGFILDTDVLFVTIHCISLQINIEES